MAVTTSQARAIGRPTERSTTARGPMSRRSRSRVAVVVRVVVSVVVSVIMAFPLWVMVVTAVSGQSVFSSQLDLWPGSFTLSNFARVFQAWPVTAWFSNSVTVTALTTIISVVVSVMAGYGFAKLRFPLKTPLFLLLLSTMMIPTQAILVPQFRLVNAMGLVGTFWAVIIPGAAATFGIFLARQFMLAIPNELIEAAKIDGAGPVRIFWSIVLPLSKPLLAVLTLLSLMYQWNDFLWPLIVLRDPSLYTLPIGLQFLQGQYQTDYGALMAMTLITVGPLVVLFLVFQRWFVQGFATSGIR
ncbi:carbohydrate ABC transporter permease [Microlunatus flavus]|uniref:Multiple sugar transport system permease protein/alpha-1,4-digalacturonate transport system permease protein n=1 Tax=Microlunatus flavus TaxID=1036181 RepID=A0A1H8ZZ12_9ACTN|nr:carbohydrate ABC transporter permease [Microlunatus flavus]SEP69497.1 multiple sugar transport system permease protein/alpha-1,4-digalacturonate transport system permease protein [Microlunatus flavus]